MRELASFVIPSHNCAAYLPQAIESVRQQTWKELEIVIVNDASDDSTHKYLGWLVGNEPRVRVINNLERKGRSVSRNLGNEAAKGKVIFVLDADDMAMPKRVELCMKKMSSADFVHGGAVAISILNEEYGPMVAREFSLKQTIEDRFKQSFIVHSTVCYKRDLALKYPYQDGEMAKLGLDDWQQQISMARAGAKFEFIPNYLCYYRRRGDSISGTRDNSDALDAKKRAFPQLFEQVAA